MDGASESFLRSTPLKPRRITSPTVWCRAPPSDSAWTSNGHSPTWSFARRPWNARPMGSSVRRRIAVGKCLEECHQLVFLSASQFQIAELFFVQRVPILRRRPARYLLTTIARFACRKRVAGVIEMHHLLERFQ